ncbi:MAG: rod shape-determining protein MreD [Alphaproteobacteria bacterium]|nr:rod shape-determining protein MreD [Alphaproteobacteria bacterium]
MADAPFLRLTQIARLATPALITLAFVIFSMVPLGLPNIGLVMPPLALMSVFYWGIYRPDLLPSLAVFAFGVLQDILGGGPIGIYAVVYVGVHAVMASQRRFFLGKIFKIEWFGFTVIAVGAFFVVWAVVSAYYGKLLAPTAFAVQALLSIALYPTLTWAMVRVRRAVSQI